MNWWMWTLLAAALAGVFVALVVTDYRIKRELGIHAAMKRHPAGKDLDNGR